MKRILSIVIILTLTLSAQAKKYDLSLNLKQGKEYFQKTSAAMTINQNLNGMEMEIKMNIKGDVVYKVRSIDNKQYVMDVAYKSMKIEMQSPQGNIVFSSEVAKTEDLMSTILSKITNKTFIVSMTKKGKLVDLKNLDVLFEEIFDGMNIPEQQKNQVNEQLKTMFGEKAFKGSFEQVTAIYPKRKMKLGGTWTTDVDLEAGMSGKLATDFTLKEVTDDYYLIHGIGNISSNSDVPYIKSKGMDIKTEMSGSLVSDIKVDKKSGWIIEASIKQELDGTTHIKANEQLPEGMNMPMSITSESTITN